jgi:hypothetical protein
VDRHFVGVTRRCRNACLAFGFVAALTLGFSASAGADDIACHGTEKPAAKAAVAAPAAPTPEAVAAILARVRVIDMPGALCPAIDEPVLTNGIWAAIDPATGQLRQPTAEEMRALRSSDRSRFERRAGTSSEPIVLPSGAVAIELGEEHMNDAIALIGADGAIVFDCGTAAGRASNAPVATTKKPEEK